MFKRQSPNYLNLKIFINEIFNYTLVIADKDSGFLQALELQIYAYFNGIKKKI